MKNNLKYLKIIPLLLLSIDAYSQDFWALDFPGASTPGIGMSTNDGNFIICYQDSWDAGIKKITVDGTMLWSHQFGDNDHDYPVWVAEIENDEYMFHYRDGDTNGPQDWNSDILVKLSQDGQILASWQIGFVWSAGGLIRASMKYNDSLFVFANNDILKMINDEGETIWETEGRLLDNLTRSIDNHILARKNEHILEFSPMGELLDTLTLTLNDDYFYYPQFQAHDNGYIHAAMRDNSSSLTKELRIVKLDSTGETLWESGHVFDNERAYLNRLVVTPNNEILVTGHLNNEDPKSTYILKYSSGGNELWYREFGCGGRTLPQNFWVAGDDYFLLSSYRLPPDDQGFYAYGMLLMNIDTSGQYSYPVAIDHQPRIAQHLSLQSWPNPFNSQINFKYDIPFDTPAQFRIYSILGETVFELSNEQLSRMKRQVSWEPTQLASGVYIVSLQSSATFIAQKVILIK